MKKFFLFLFCCFIFSLNAQDWVNFTNGLDVNDVVQDGNTLWIGTTGGLVKRNLETGENLYYTRGDSPIPSNSVISLALDLEGNIWVSTNLGTALFDGTDWTVFYDKSGLLHLDNDGEMVIASTDYIHWWDGQDFRSVATDLTDDYRMTDIAVDPLNDDVWVTYQTYLSFSVARYNEDGLTIFNYENSPLPAESSNTNSLIIDEQNRLWLGTYYGIYRFNNGEWFEFSNEVSGFPQGKIVAVEMANDGKIWTIVNDFFSEPKNVLIEIDNDDQFVFHEFPAEIADKASIDNIHFLEDASNSSCFGTDKFGLWEYNLTSWDIHETSQSELLNNYIAQVYVDCGTVYLSTSRNAVSDYNELFYIEEGKWNFFNNDDLPSSMNSSNYSIIVDEEKDGPLWIHSGNKLHTLVNGNVELTQEIPDLLEEVDETDSYIYHEPDGKIWLLERYNSYIFHETDEGWEIFGHEEHGAVSGIYTTYFTHPKTGDFWLASANGISQYDGENWTIYKPGDLEGFYTDWVYDMKVDADGSVLALTRGGILKVLDNTLESFLMEVPGYDGYNFKSFAFDSQDRLWLGMNGVLAREDGANWQFYDNTNSGIPNGAINKLQFDDADNLWIGSGGGGLAVFNEKGLPGYILNKGDIVQNDSLPNQDKIFFSLVPNSVSKDANLFIEISDSFEINKSSEMIIYNGLGQLITTFQVCTRYFLMPAHQASLPAGAYYFQLRNDAESSVQKVVVH